MYSTDDKRNLCQEEADSRTTDLSQQPASYPRAPQYQYGTQAHHEQQTYCYPTQPVAPPPSVLPYDLDQVMVVPFVPRNRGVYSPKSLTLAVILCIPIMGLFGAHHFYLNNMLLGGLYCSTMGIFGIGWVVDWFRIPWLVKRCNQDMKETHEKGHWLFSINRFIGPLTKISLIDAYLMWLPPMGLFGMHHFYLGRTRYAVFQTFTFGLNVIGWAVDLFRMPWLVRKANEDVTKMKAGIKVEDPSYSLMDAYLMAVPLGLFGFHHFYLGNTRRGILFLCTFGVFGLGWLADLFQMPLIVSEANKERQLRERLNGVLTHHRNQASATTVVVVPAGDRYQATAGYLIEQPPAYSAQDTTGPNNHDLTVQNVQLPPQNGCNSMAGSEKGGKFVS
ncbi:uncharacterized protein LOC129256491 [Lytechinus pictus]|uniref:uncharacterized protein LOC129256491 n=1 Tax=Lytechinus pictus TaxID=7653 RepID=UPI0030B9BBC7